MLIKIIVSALFLKLILIQGLYSQTRPSLQFTAGFAFPGNDFAGELVSSDVSGNIFINPDFIRNNYAVSKGASITGTLKFPIGRAGIFSPIVSGSYSFFNAFRSSTLGTTIENNISVPVTYDNRFSITAFAIGMEASAGQRSGISPFINANICMNILSLTLSKNDAASVIFNDAVRMGLLTNAGLSYKLSEEYALVLNGSYSFGNLFFKSSKGDYNDRIEFNTENNPLNDKEGSYYTNLSDPSSPPVQVSGKNKNVNWWGIGLGLNILLGKSDKK